MKYDKMVARNRAVSREKVTLAKVAIGELLRENEAVTVVSLVQKGSFSIKTRKSGTVLPGQGSSRETRFSSVPRRHFLTGRWRRSLKKQRDS